MMTAVVTALKSSLISWDIPSVYDVLRTGMGNILSILLQQ
jgi:hypothetical protein